MVRAAAASARGSDVPNMVVVVDSMRWRIRRLIFRMPWLVVRTVSQSYGQIRESGGGCENKAMARADLNGRHTYLASKLGYGSGSTP